MCCALSTFSLWHEAQPLSSRNGPFQSQQVWSFGPSVLPRQSHSCNDHRETVNKLRQGCACVNSNNQCLEGRVVLNVLLPRPTPGALGRNGGRAGSSVVLRVQGMVVVVVGGVVPAVVAAFCHAAWPRVQASSPLVSWGVPATPIRARIGA